MENVNKERKWIIYMYTFPNGKRYIGKTCRSLKDGQESSEWVGYKNCPVLWNAICKYKIQNIRQDILFENYMTDKYSSMLEMICIALFKTNCNRYSNPSYGYNETDGGEGTIGHKHNNDAKEKMRQSKIGKTGKDANGSKSIYCIELDKYFSSAIEAEIEIGVNRKLISNCIRGVGKSTHGGNTEFCRIHWMLANEVTHDKISYILNTPNVVRSSRAVYCVDMDKTFESAKFAESIGFGNQYRIRDCCVNHWKTTKDKNGCEHHWMYADDINVDEVNLILNDQLINNKKRLIYCPELHRNFAGIRCEERELGITYGCINFAIKNGTTTDGPDEQRLHWIMVE